MPALASIVVANRTPERAAPPRRAVRRDRAIPLSDLAEATGPVDVLVSCTGAAGFLIDADAISSRRTDDAPLAVVDLALPRDVDPSVADLPGVRLIALETLAAELEEAPGGADVDGVRTIVAQELAAFLTARRSQSVTPTVVALRTMATGRRRGRARPDRPRDCPSSTTPRAPRWRSRSAGSPRSCSTSRPSASSSWPTSRGAISYAAALAELFALDPEAVEAVTRADV